MKTSKLLLSIALIGGISFSSCSKDPVCKKCSAEQVIYQDGEEVGKQSISAVEYCDDALKSIESNRVVTIDQKVGEHTQKIVSTYTCK